MQYGPKSKICKALFVETGTYNDLVSRPWDTHVDIPVLHAFQEATRGGTSISAATLSGVAGAMMRPQTEGEGLIAIANGWDTRRLRFMLEIEHEQSFGGRLRQYVTGYTNHVGVVTGMNGQTIIDPNMMLYLNNSITLTSVQEQTPMGIILRSTVADVSHVLSGTYAPAFNGNGNVTHTMRPEDVFSTMSLGVLSDTSNVFDGRTTFAQGMVKKSARNNGSAPTYLSKVLNAHQYGMSLDQNNGADLVEVTNNARGMVLEGLVADDMFLGRLSRETSLSQGSSLTYSELCSLDSTLDSRVVVSLSKPTVQDTHRRGDTENWNNRMPETVAATMLCSSVPSLMTQLMLTGIAFMATNRTMTGEYDVRILGQKSFVEGMDLTPYLQMFQQRLEVEVLRNLSSNNQIPFAVTMQCDLLGETTVDISIGDGPMVPFNNPQFSDALSAPVVTQNVGTVRQMASDIETLASNLEKKHYDSNIGDMTRGYATSL